MAEMEEKLGAILNNPQLMQQIMSMAQSLGHESPRQEQPEAPAQADTPPELPNIDFSMVQKLSGLAGQTGINQNQKALLSALGPYLSQDRVGKLEKAMRAAKMAQLASSFLNQGGLSFLTGR